MSHWERLRNRPSRSTAARLREGEAESEQVPVRVLLLMRDPTTIERLRRSLLRQNIWCAPCLRREDLVSTLRALEFSCVVLDLDDPVLDATDALPSIGTLHPHLPRIGLTASSRLGAELGDLVEELLLQPLDLGELVATIRRRAYVPDPLPHAQGA